MENVTVNYRGVAIDVNVDYGIFNAVDNGEFGQFRSERMQEVKEWIDKKIEAKERREKKEFKRIPVYLKRYSEIYEAEITSIADSGEYWLSYDETFRGKTEKKRAKVYASDLYRKEPGTKIVFDRIKDRKSQVEALEKLIRDDMNMLDAKARLTSEELAIYREE